MCVGEHWVYSRKPTEKVCKNWKPVKYYASRFWDPFVFMCDRMYIWFERGKNRECGFFAPYINKTGMFSKMGGIQDRAPSVDLFVFVLWNENIIWWLAI
jgi:hypothetical protein